MLPIIHGEFRLVDDPELRFTPSGQAVANVRLVAQNRKLNKDTNEWEDDENNILWINGSVWKQYAENVAESLRKGDLVFVSGKIRTRSWETNEGEKRSVCEINIDEIGPTLRWRSVLHSDGHGGKVTREGAQADTTARTDADPWATQSQEGRDPWAPSTDEPPF